MPENDSSPGRRETPPKKKKCESASSDPVTYSEGQVLLSETDLEWKGLGFSWRHRRSYSNVLNDGGGYGGSIAGEHGHHWFLDDMPFLHFGNDPGTGTPTIGVITGASGSDWFISNGSGGWDNQFGGHSTLQHDTVAREYVLTGNTGEKTIFHDDDSGLSEAVRGRLKGIENPGGGRASLTYNLDSELEKVSWSGVNGGTVEFQYTYYDEIAKLGLIETATLVINGIEVRRATYDYYELDDDNGPLRTLQNAKVEEPGGTTGAEWLVVTEQWYRYFTESNANGAWKYGLRVVLGPEGVAQCRAAGIDPETASDSDLAPYATHQFEFDGEGRVTNESIRGDESDFSFEWLTNSADPDFTDVNTWYRRCIETRPDGSTRRVYTNRGGGTILDIKVEAGASPGKWNDYFVFDSSYHQLEHATSAAVASVSEPANAAGSLNVTLEQNDGLIRVNDYYTADDLPNGEVKGYLKTRGVKVGSTSSVVVLSKRTYATRTVGNASIHPVADEFAYPVAGASDNDAAKTSYAYTWYDDEFSSPTFQMEEKVMAMPTIAAADHGTGNAESVTMRYDRNGFETWKKDARGTIAHSVYDEINGALIQKIDDVDTNDVENVPVGWVTPTGGGLNFVTDFENDLRGRLLRRIGPERDAVIDVIADDVCREPGHETLTVRTVDYTLYLDSIHQTWTASGYVTGYNSSSEAWHLEGPVSIDRRNAGDVTVDTIQVRPACPCAALAYDSLGSLDSANRLPDRKFWTRWTRTERDFWGRKTSEKAYFEIPESGEGFEQSNFLFTQFGYDSLNRLNQTVAPDGTITRTVANRLDDITAEWVGTDDTGATASDPGNGGNDGNNLVVVRAMEYDGDSSGGNGLLTKLSLPVDGTPANDRITTYTYDGRDRKTQSTASDGTRDFIEILEYDNLDQETINSRYHSNVADVNRVQRKETKFDLQRRIYQEVQYGADPANGNLKGPLTLGLWYDPNGNVISETAAGADNATKTDYDGLNRIVTRYKVVPGTVPSGASANDVTNDVVVEQDEFAYDGENNLIFFTHRQRLHDATGTGALGTVSGDQPRARVSFRAIYFDAIDRERFEADFGTNGGADLLRPTDVPSRSATALVSETSYAKDGQPGTLIDREGTKTVTRRDKLNRVIATVEAAGADAERTTRYRWHSSGQLESLILENPDTGEQVTEWSYGATRPDSKVARNDLPVSKTYPTGESESQTWNRQSQQLEFTDCNGTIHDYTYDKVGNLLRDAVTTLATGINGAVRRLEFAFNSQGLLSSAGSWSDPASGSGTLVNEVEFTYDAFGNVASDAQEHSGAVDGNTPTVTYQRTDGSNNLYRQSGITYPSNAAQEFDYGSSGSIDEAFNRAANLKVTGESTNLVEYEFAGIGRVVTIDYAGSDAKLSYLKPSGFVGTGDAGDDMTGYDRFGRTVAMPWAKRSDNSALATISYGYDLMSRRTFRGDATPAANGEFDQHFSYDPLGQVISRTRGTLNDSRSAVGGIPEAAEAWQYDEQGNWLGYDLNEAGTSVVDQTRTHNSSNQIVSIDGSGADTEYDANGNMSLVPTGRGLEGSPKKVTWDAWNRITKVQEENDDLISEYRYDALFRRITRQLPDAPLRHTYYNNKWRPVEEQRDGLDDPVKLWWWGDRHRDDLSRRDQDTTGNGTMDEKLWCLMDYFDPIAIVDSSGAVQERYSYSAFGVSRVAAADYTERSSNLSQFDWEFRFHGQFEDLETGWMNYGYRYYVPEIGNWPNRDPIGEKGGDLLYCFTLNNPTTLNDLFGLKACCPEPDGEEYDPSTHCCVEAGLSPPKVVKRLSTPVERDGPWEKTGAFVSGSKMWTSPQKVGEDPSAWRRTSTQRVYGRAIVTYYITWERDIVRKWESYEYGVLEQRRAIYGDNNCELNFIRYEYGSSGETRRTGNKRSSTTTTRETEYTTHKGSTVLGPGAPNFVPPIEPPPT